MIVFKITYKMYKSKVLFLFIFIHYFMLVFCSEGDRSPFYQKCVNNCKGANCTSDGSFTPEAGALQDSWSAALSWDCISECRYNCMWRTVAAFEERGYQIPKFHGKWPFRRMLGVQEPASAFCSLLNLAAHAHMYSKIVRDKRFSISSTPLLLFWHFFVLICLNAWSWSTIFHTRDTPFTEFMDYAGALSMVMALFIAAAVRILYGWRVVSGALVLFSLAYYAAHARYLYHGGIDYDYNIAINVIFGVIGSIIWLLFCLTSYCAYGGAGARRVWRLVLFTVLSGAALLLELFDFPPVINVWDAHALWHLATAPLPLLFYGFVIDDLDYLQTLKQSEKTDFKLA